MTGPGRARPFRPGVVRALLRLYPPAWIGPRRATQDFEFGGYTVPANWPVAYSSWASHRLPDVFPEPNACAAKSTR